MASCISKQIPIKYYTDVFKYKLFKYFRSIQVFSVTIIKIMTLNT